MLSNEQEITDLPEINTHIYHIYQHLYNEKQNTTEDSKCDFLNDLAVLSLTMELSLSCKENLTDIKICSSLKSFEMNESAGNDKLTQEFSCTFWNDSKDTFMNSLK